VPNFKLQKFSEYAFRQEYLFKINVESFFIYAKNPGFLTLTFSDDLQFTNISDWKESSRRFNSIRTNIFKEHIRFYLCVIEPTGNGRIHFHILADFKKHIRGNCSLDDIRKNSKRKKEGLKQDWSMCHKNLFKYWDVFKNNCEKYNFGMAYHLVPIIAEGNDYIKNYLGNYLRNFLTLTERVDQNFRGRLVRKSFFIHEN